MVVVRLRVKCERWCYQALFIRAVLSHECPSLHHLLAQLGAEGIGACHLALYAGRGRSSDGMGVSSRRRCGGRGRRWFGVRVVAVRFGHQLSLQLREVRGGGEADEVAAAVGLDVGRLLAWRSGVGEGVGSIEGERGRGGSEGGGARGGDGWGMDGWRGGGREGGGRGQRRGDRGGESRLCGGGCDEVALSCLTLSDAGHAASDAVDLSLSAPQQRRLAGGAGGVEQRPALDHSVGQLLHNPIVALAHRLGRREGGGRRRSRRRRRRGGGRGRRHRSGGDGGEDARQGCRL